jgi:uncharacterized protein with GYD domain
MPKFALFFRLSGATVAAAMETPTDRAAVVEQLCREAGGHMESYFWMFGDHDGMVIFDVPNSAAAAAVSLTVSSSGACTGITTHELIPASEINDRLAEAKRLSAIFTPPGTQPH